MLLFKVVCRAMIGVKSVATSFEGSLVASTLPMASPVVEFLRNVVRGNDMSWQRIERVRLSLGLTTKQLSYQILSSNRDKCRIELDAIGGMMRAAPWGREQLPHLTRRELVKKHHSKNTPARGRQSREKQHDEELPLPPPPPHHHHHHHYERHASHHYRQSTQSQHTHPVPEIT